MWISLAITALMLLSKAFYFKDNYYTVHFNYFCQYDISRLSKPAKAVFLNLWSVDLWGTMMSSQRVYKHLKKHYYLELSLGNLWAWTMAIKGT